MLQECSAATIATTHGGKMLRNVTSTPVPVSRCFEVFCRALFLSYFPAVTWQAWLLLTWLVVVPLQSVRLLIQRLRLASFLKQGTPAGLSGSQ